MMIDQYVRPREGITIPRFWLTLALSLLIHVAVFWKVVSPLHHMTQDEPEQGANSGRLAVRLAPPAARLAPPEPPPEPAPEPAPKVNARPPQPKRSTLQTAPVIAVNKPPAAPAQTAATPPVETAPPRPPSDGDLAAFIEARRRAREAGSLQQPSPGLIASAPVETDADRAKRITAANLTPKQAVFGYDPAAGGGVFQIRRISLNDAEVAFYGWNREIRRKTLQILEISKGNNSDIRIAVVRKMIALIREYESEDFRWESRGRTVTLSARLRDNGQLEEYMLREFFPDQTVAR